LELIVISNGSVKELHQADLKPFPELKSLLMPNNQINNQLIINSISMRFNDCINDEDENDFENVKKLITNNCGNNKYAKFYYYLKKLRKIFLKFLQNHI